MNSFIILQGITYIGVIIGAVYFSYRNGEKEGSMYMLEYLRENKFFKDSDYMKFMKHMSEEKEKSNEK
jgi:hypothetical protein